MRVIRRPFGTLPDGTPIDEFVLTDGGAIELRAVPYGGIITSLVVPDRDGRGGNVVLGHERLEPYLENPPYFGAIVGRYANRIALGRFTLDGRTYQLATNDGHHHLHGGVRGFDRHLWDALPITAADAAGVAFTRTSPSGEEHYPGTLHVTVSYRLTGRGEVLIGYEATTDAPTIVNLTQHTYFNLTADLTRTVLGHELTIDADQYTPVNDELIPTGDIASVDGTRFDFRRPRAIGEGNYDHNWVIARRGRELAHAARAVDPGSGRTLDVWTTEPGVQFYDGNLLGGPTPASWGGRTFPRHTGFCLETQHYPDSPNNPLFPSTVLRPGERFQSSTVWRFGAA